MQLLKRVKWVYVVLSGFLAGLGECLFVWPDIPAVTVCCAIGGGAVSRGLAIGGAAQGHIAVAKESAVGTYTFVRDVGGTVSGTELWGVIKREFPHMWDWVRDVIQWLLVM